MPEEQKIGQITHFFTHISVGVVELTDGSLKVGDRVHIKGATTDFEQVVSSMQIEKKAIKEAKKGDTIGLKVKERVRKGDQVFKIQ